MIDMLILGIELQEIKIDWKWCRVSNNDLSLIYRIILVMWLECWFLDTEVDCSNPTASVCCVLEQDILSALPQL